MSNMSKIQASRVRASKKSKVDECLKNNKVYTFLAKYTQLRK